MLHGNAGHLIIDTQTDRQTSIASFQLSTVQVLMPRDDIVTGAAAVINLLSNCVCLSRTIQSVKAFDDCAYIKQPATTKVI